MGILKTGKITVWTVLATLLTASILLVYSLNSVSAGNNHNDHDDHCYEHRYGHDDCDDHDDHRTATPRPTATPSARPSATATATPVATQTPTPSASPTKAPTEDPITVVHDGKGDGLGCAVNDCSGNKVAPAIEGYGVGGQVLGASTMAGTGSFDEMFYQAIMVLGGTLTTFGARGLKKAKKVSKK